jgi:NAD(P)-dependent dehydrogenase (short-subunit alcohol dehydrogenase family)
VVPLRTIGRYADERQTKAQDPGGDRRLTWHRPRDGDALCRLGLARHQLLAACLSRELSVGDGTRGSPAGRSCRCGRYRPRHRRAESRLEPEGALLHALVNNAGISPKGDGGARLNTIDTAIDDWQHVFQVNFFAPIMLARGLFDELERAQGAIVNVTSIAGGRVHPFAGSAYATSKAALMALTREMAADFGPRGIRVNAISPGEIDTAILSPGTGKIVEEQIPMQRLGAPEEVARAIYFLCSEQSSYVHGAELHINGGQHV